ncbi:uncharacterized protein LOC125196330 isoform X1 [Salvia hispanica]|uniref:uncharacterized protein LOC125196330 isoform X1 n=1 Tax=Salvia hispanica TaxID=49212 RepID=UPI0020096A13|nr:uncharacterized protein LOC125196330 isoform X1 [Salvia hispanica]
MASLQLKLFMVLLISAVCSKISVQTPTCGNNTFFIQYPFTLLQEGQNPHHTTPYNLKCNRQKLVALNLPFSGEFYVRDINYFQQKIQLYDPSNCLPKRLKNLSLPSSPFMAVSYQNYTFFSCPLGSPSSRNLTAIRCLSNSTASVVAASETSMMDGIKNLTACKVLYSLQVPVSQVFEYAYNGIDGDLQLAWIDPSSKGNSRGITSSKPGALTIILICAITILTALLVAMLCLGCGLTVVVVMLDIEEANNQGSWSCSTRVWERARFRLSRASNGTAGPLDEVSFMSTASQQPQSAVPRGAAAPLNESSSTLPPPVPPPSPPPRIAAVHPFGYYLSFMPSSPQVPREALGPLDELPSTSLSPNVAVEAPDGFATFMSSPQVSSMPAAGDREVFIEATPPGDSTYRSLTQLPMGASTPLHDSPDVSLQTPSVSEVNPFSYFLSPAASPQGLRGASAPLDEVQSNLSSPSVAADDVDGFVSVIPSPELWSMLATREDGFFIDDSSVISSPQVQGGAAAPLDDSSSALPPPPPPPSVGEGRPLDYFLSLLSAHFRRGNAVSSVHELSSIPPSPSELSSTPSSPSVTGDLSFIPSPLEDEVHDNLEELPTEDIIIGGSECISGPNGDSCPICLENYKASERLRVIRNCNHCFHSDCLDLWLQRKSTCPICRTNVS